MKSAVWDDATLADHRSSINEDSARAAFDTLVAAAIDTPAYEAEPAWQGAVRIFKYVDPESGERPFAFIVNRRDLLFYVRTPGLKHVAGGFAELRRQFNTALKNKRGEWTVRVVSKEDAERLNARFFTRSISARKLSSGVLDGISRNDVLGALKRLDAGVPHKFADSVKYDLVYESRRYAPKAVIGLAAERVVGRVLGPYDFRGGEETKCFRILEKLGFEIKPKIASVYTTPTRELWRSDQKLAGEILERILAGLPPEVRRRSIEALQRSVAFAREHYPDRWLLTLHPTYVRFIAGMVMCLQFRSNNQASVLLLKKLAPPGLKKKVEVYPRAPGCVEIGLSTGELASKYSSLREALEGAIIVCALTHSGAGGHRSAHSPGLVDYLEKLLGNMAAEVNSDFPNELNVGLEYIEGSRKHVWVNAFERDSKARQACINHYGLSCAVCDFNFEGRYGERGKDFIHVHHLKPMALTDGQYELDPVVDLRPVCPNCHAMLHRGEHVLSIEELRSRLR